MSVRFGLSFTISPIPLILRRQFYCLSVKYPSIHVDISARPRESCIFSYLSIIDDVLAKTMNVSWYIIEYIYIDVDRNYTMYNLKTRRHSQNEHAMGANIIDDDHVCRLLRVMYRMRWVSYASSDFRSDHLCQHQRRFLLYVFNLCVDVELCAQFIDQF